MEKTYVPKGKVESGWILVDADGQGLGRMATVVAAYLLGKHKPIYTPGVDTGDFVVVINTKKLKLTNKRMETKFYYHHSNYPGGLKTVSLRDQINNRPDRVLRHAVWGMLPHNHLGRLLINKLKVYSGSEHPHAAQNPKAVA